MLFIHTTSKRCQYLKTESRKFRHLLHDLELSLYQTYNFGKLSCQSAKEDLCRFYSTSGLWICLSDRNCYILKKSELVPRGRLLGRTAVAGEQNEERHIR